MVLPEGPDMPVAARKIIPEDILPDAAFAPLRAERRAALLPIKRLRRVARQVEVGEAPATSYWRFGKRRRRNICAAARECL